MVWQSARLGKLKSPLTMMYDQLMIDAALNAAFVVGLLCCAFTPGQRNDFAGCLPAEISSDTIVLVQPSKSTSGATTKRTTVKETLIQLRARCKRGKLRDRAGREIYFYTLVGCWGNPPADYLEMLQRQEREIQRLKKRYTVIQIPCAQSIDPRKIN